LAMESNVSINAVSEFDVRLVVVLSR